MQNLVVFVEPSEEAWKTPLKGGNLILNRLCIDEDAAFELSGVNYLKTSSDEMASMDVLYSKGRMVLQRKRFIREGLAKGKEFSFLKLTLRKSSPP